MSLFEPPFPPDPWSELAVRERLASEGVDEIVDFDAEDDRVKLISWYGLCFCGEPYRGRRRARIRDFDNTIELIEDACCTNGHEM